MALNKNPGAYVEGKVFKNDFRGKAHLGHVLREEGKYNKAMIPEAKLEVRGDIQKIYQQKMKRRRKDGNYYYEIVCYPEKAEQIDTIASWLGTYLKNYVLSVVHNDESKLHVHYLMPWRRQDGTAMRFKKGNFLEINQHVSQAVGRRRTSRGQGTRKIERKEWLADPEEAKRKVVEMKQVVGMRLESAEEILRLYGKIEIAALGEEGQEYKLMTIDHIDNYNIKQCERLHVKGNNIVFRPVATNDRVQTLFLSDLPLEATKRLPGLVVKTSPGRYQCHIPLSEPVDVKEAQAMQRAICNCFEGNRRFRSDVFCYRAMPGWGNKKYGPGSQVEIERPYDEKKTSVKVIREHLEKNKAMRFHALLAMKKMQLAKLPKQWNDFDSHDLWVQDRRYVFYLLARRVAREEIRARLISESEDIAVRKSNVDEYINAITEDAMANLYKEADQEYEGPRPY